jgi:hypothetical protein
VTTAEVSKTLQLLHPFGNLTFTQKFVPLNFTFNKFGNSEPSDFNHFTIQSVTADAALPISPIRDSFPTGEFTYLNEQQKLSFPSFSSYESGVRIGGTDQLRSSYINRMLTKYDEKVLDSAKQTRRRFIDLPLSEFNGQLKANAAARSSSSPNSKPLPSDAPAQVKKQELTYGVIYKDSRDLLGGTTAVFNSRTEALAYQKTMEAQDPKLRSKTQVVFTNTL